MSWDTEAGNVDGTLTYVAERCDVCGYSDHQLCCCPCPDCHSYPCVCKDNELLVDAESATTNLTERN